MQITAEFARTLERELAAALGAAKGALRSIDAVLADNAVCGQNYARLRVAKMILELSPAPLPEPRMMQANPKVEHVLDQIHAVEHEENHACGLHACLPVEPVCVWSQVFTNGLFHSPHGAHAVAHMGSVCPTCGKKVEVRA
jgi:hypothetical protein